MAEKKKNERLVLQSYESQKFIEAEINEYGHLKVETPAELFWLEKDEGRKLLAFLKEWLS